MRCSFGAPLHRHGAIFVTLFCFRRRNRNKICNFAASIANGRKWHDYVKNTRFPHNFTLNILRFPQFYVILPSKTEIILRNGC